jgi:hypothetical protein
MLSFGTSNSEKPRRPIRRADPFERGRGPNQIVLAETSLSVREEGIVAQREGAGLVLTHAPFRLSR